MLTRQYKQKTDLEELACTISVAFLSSDQRVEVCRHLWRNVRFHLDYDPAHAPALHYYVEKVSRIRARRKRNDRRNDISVMVVRRWSGRHHVPIGDG